MQRRIPKPTTFSPSLFRRSLSGAPITPLQHRILVELCEHSQMDKPVVKPGLDRLAENCGCTRAAICTNLNKLQALGYIQKVGSHIGGNSGTGRWRLVYGGIRERSDGGGPIWDPGKMDSNLFSERCPACSQLSTPVAQLSTQTLSTVNADALNCQPRLTLSSYEVERSNYEVDASACGATPPPGGGAPHLGDAPEFDDDPIPVNNDDESLRVYSTWDEWWSWERVDDLAIPEDRPARCCSRKSHQRNGRPAPGCQPCATADQTYQQWLVAYQEWQDDTQAKRAAIRDCRDCDADGYQFGVDGSMRWCAHDSLRQAEIEAERQAEARAELIADVHEAVLAVHGASAAAYATGLDWFGYMTERNVERADVIGQAIAYAGNWIAECEAQAAEAKAAAAEAAEAAKQEADDLEYERECEINCTQCGDRGRKIGDSFIRADDGTALVLVFPPGRMPPVPDDDELKPFRMTVGHPDNPFGLVEYAQLECSHREDNNAFSIDWYIKEYGVDVTSMRALNRAGNGIRGALPTGHTDTTAAIAGFVSPALPSADDAVDAEVVDSAELLDERAEPTAIEPALDGGVLGVDQELPGPLPGLAEIEEW